jgi:PAS domain S-box-containing protein
MMAETQDTQQGRDQLDLRNLIERLPALVLCALPDGSVEFANRAYHEYTGWSVEELSGRGWQTLIHPEDHREFKDHWGAALASGKAFETEARLRQSNGQYHWFLIKKALAVSRTQGGEPSLRALIACEDIDDRKLEESARLYSEEQYRVVVETASDAILSIDDGGTIQFANPASERIFGYKSSDLIGKPLTVLMPEFLRTAHESGLKRYLTTGQRHINWQGTEFRALRKNGQEFPVEVSFGELDRDGHRVFTGFIRDISKRKQAEDRLRETELELARVSRLTTMGELSASIAHEVNQPLTAVTNNGNACLRLLADHNLEPEVLRHALKEMVADSTRAGAVIARIRAFIRKTPPQKIQVDINEVIQEVLVLAGHRLQENRVSLERQVTKDLPLVMADRVQLQQVLLNLLMNAIEAMSAVTNRPRLLWVQSQLDESGDILVAIRDSGTGLSSEADSLFTPFVTTKADGIGMGLPISRSLIEGLGGRLWAEANVPHGAVFKFTLPVADQSLA